MKSSKVDLKVCSVCGDKALGYNFNAITCESCKAFFRRNALIQKPLKCPFNNQCDITTLTRRFCQKCRLDKCFFIGMCKDLIMSEQDKVAKRQKIEENRVKRQSLGKFKSNFKKVKREYLELDTQHSESHSNTDSDSNYTNPDIASPPQPSPQYTSPPQFLNECTNTSVDSTESGISSPSDRYTIPSDEITTAKNNLVPTDLNNKLINGAQCAFNLNMNHLNNTSSSKTTSCAGDSNRNSSSKNSSEHCNFITYEDISQVMNDVHSGRSEDNPIESILCEAIKLEFQAFSSIGQSPSNSRELNDAERAKLNELIVANKAFLTPVDEEFKNLVGVIDFENTQHKMDTTPALVDVINLTTIYVRRLIKMAKKIGAFRNMCQEDQVALLKGGCTEVMMVRSAMNYDTKIQSWQIPHSRENFRINSKILKLVNKGTVYNDHEKFIQTFSPLWNGDENIILILCMILLFSPDRPKVVHQDVIKLEQNAYYYLLRRYLESIYAGCEAKSIFLKLMQKLIEIRRVNEELISVYLNVNPSDIEPLLSEIFDLHR